MAFLRTRIKSDQKWSKMCCVGKIHVIWKNRRGEPKSVIESRIRAPSDCWFKIAL